MSSCLHHRQTGVDWSARGEIQHALRRQRGSVLTTDHTRERPMLIKELQDLQHHHGYLPREALQALAVRLKVPFFEVYGVASF